MSDAETLRVPQEIARRAGRSTITQADLRAAEKRTGHDVKVNR